MWRRKPTDMYVIEITTDKTFKALTVQDASTDGNYNQVNVHSSIYIGRANDVHVQIVISGTNIMLNIVK